MQNSKPVDDAKDAVPPVTTPTETDIGKVRRILFGEQMDSMESRVDSVQSDLREDLAKEVRELREEIRVLEGALAARVQQLEDVTVHRSQLAAALRTVAESLEGGPMTNGQAASGGDRSTRDGTVSRRNGGGHPTATGSSAASTNRDG